MGKRRLTGVSAFSSYVPRLYHSLSGSSVRPTIISNACFSQFWDRVILWKFTAARRIVKYVGLVISSRYSGEIQYNYELRMMLLTRQKVVMEEYM
jgi:hypothetical protein